MKKNILILGMVIALTLVWITPIQPEAEIALWCSEWGDLLDRTTYCATPVCSMAIPTQFTDIKQDRMCYYGLLFDIRREYQIRKEVNGCCDHL